MTATALGGTRKRRSRFLLMPLIVMEVAGTGYLIADAAGAFRLAAGQQPREVGLFIVGLLGLLATVVFCCALAAVPSPSKVAFAWLVAPLCAAFLAAFFYSHDHAADGYVPRYADEHADLRTWVALVCVGGVLAGVLTHLRPRVGFAFTSVLALASFLPILVVALAGH